MEFRSVKLHKAFEDELLFLMRDILHRRGLGQFVQKDVDLALCLLLDTQIQFKPNIISSSCSHWILVDAGLQISPKINAKHVEPAVAEDLRCGAALFPSWSKTNLKFCLSVPFGASAASLQR